MCGRKAWIWAERPHFLSKDKMPGAASLVYDAFTLLVPFVSMPCSACMLFRAGRPLTCGFILHAHFFHVPLATPGCMKSMAQNALHWMAFPGVYLW